MSARSTDWRNSCHRRILGEAVEIGERHGFCAARTGHVRDFSFCTYLASVRMSSETTRRGESDAERLFQTKHNVQKIGWIRPPRSPTSVASGLTSSSSTPNALTKAVLISRGLLPRLAWNKTPNKSMGEKMLITAQTQTAVDGETPARSRTRRPGGQETATAATSSG